MLKFVTGDLFESKAGFLVNPCNCKGVAGDGLSKVFKDKLGPPFMRAYQEDCRLGRLIPGKCTLYKYYEKGLINPWVINFPTKNHWKNPSELKWIRPGLDSLAELIDANTLCEDISSVAIPKLGCGLGGLFWADVKQVIKDWYCELSFHLDVEVYV